MAVSPVGLGVTKAAFRKSPMSRGGSVAPAIGPAGEGETPVTAAVVQSRGMAFLSAQYSVIPVDPGPVGESAATVPISSAPEEERPTVTGSLPRM